MRDDMVCEGGAWFCQRHPNAGFDMSGPWDCPKCRRGEPAEPPERRFATAAATSAAFAFRRGGLLSVSDYHGQALFLDACERVRAAITAEREGESARRDLQASRR